MTRSTLRFARTVLLIAVFAGPASAVKAAMLKLDAVEGRREFAFAGAREDKLWVLEKRSSRTAAKDAVWQLRGNLRAAYDIVCWSPSYRVVRSLDSTGRWTGPRRYFAEVSMAVRRRFSDEHPSDWVASLAEGDAAAVFVWLVNGRPTQVEVKPLAYPSESADLARAWVGFDLDPDDVGGQPVLLLWSGGKFATAPPRFSSPATQQAFVSILLDDVGSLRREIKRGLALDERPPGGASLMHYAAESGAVRAIDLLVARHPELVNAKDEQGGLPAHWAAANGRNESLRRLLRAGAAFTGTSREAPPLLIRAVRNGHIETVRLLVESGASVQTGSDGFSPLLAALGGGYGDIVELLCEAGEENSRLLSLRSSIASQTAFEGKIGLLEWAIAHGAVLDENLPYRTPVVLRATRRLRVDAIEILLNAGAPVDAADPNGITALMEAASQGHVASLDRLLRAGAQVNLASRIGDTALHYAARSNSPEAIERLLAAGAKRDALNHAGRTPLTAALLVHATAAAEFLIKTGATFDPNAPSAAETVAAAVEQDCAAFVELAFSSGWRIDRIVTSTWTAARMAAICQSSACLEALQRAGVAPAQDERCFTFAELDKQALLAHKPLFIDPRDPDENALDDSLVVDLVVDETGRPHRPRFSWEAPPHVRAAVFDLLHRTRYKPGMIDGRPVPSQAQLFVPIPGRDRRVFEHFALKSSGSMPRVHFRVGGAGNRVETVVVSLVIDKTGQAVDVWTDDVRSGLVADYIRAARQLKFPVGELRGRPVVLRLTRSVSIRTGGDQPGNEPDSDVAVEPADDST